MKAITCIAAAAVLAAASSAVSQTPAPAPTTPAAPAAPTAPPAATTAPAAPVDPTAPAIGMPVKDVAGATFGEVALLTTDAAGAKLVTIKIGDEAFTVGADKLRVENGAAQIFATQAQIKELMKKQAPAAPATPG